MDNAKVNQQNTEPTIMGRTNELLNYVATAERHLRDLDSGILGKDAAPEKKADTPTSLEGMLADATMRVASICGWLATIKNRIGCHEWSEVNSAPAPISDKKYYGI